MLIHQSGLNSLSTDVGLHCCFGSLVSLNGMDDSRWWFYYLGVSDYLISLKFGTNNPITLENHGITQIENQNTRNYGASKLAGHHERLLSKSAGCMTNINPMQGNNLYLYTRLRIDIQGTSKNLSSKFTSLAGKDRIFTTISTQLFAPETETKSCLFFWFLSPATVGVIAYIGVWSNDQWLKIMPPKLTKIATFNM